MSQARKLKACDLFCGAGGTTTGAVMSGHVDVVLAINHWRVAVSSHGLNHPDTRHICAEIDNVNPREFRDMGINLLLASPECVGHSNAKGDAPVDDQRRATAWCVPRWLEMLRPKYAVIENVREFQNWGPLIPKRDKDTGKIVKDKKGRTAMVLDPERKGEIFDAWVAAIRGIGYRVEWRLLNAADFGGATKRIRLFMICRLGKSRAAMPWPKPTHTPEQYTPAAAIIDWGLDCPSIFTRKKPLVDKTIRRIEIGVRKFAAVEPKPFLVDRNWQENRGGRNRVHDIEQPLTTVTGQNAQGLVQPFVVNLHGKSTAQSTDTPTPTVTGNRNLGLAQPFLVPNLGEPLATVTTKERHGLAIASYGERLAGLREQFGHSPAMLSLINTMEEFGIADIGYRMLVNNELKRAQGFPEDYLLMGTEAEVTKQIGNSVHTAVANAIARAIGEAETPKPRVKKSTRGRKSA